MSSDDRIRRPSLDRTEPIRAWSSLLGGGPLNDVTLAGGVGEEPLTIRVRVPPDTPPGVYNGLVVEETTSRPAGTLSLRIIGP